MRPDVRRAVRATLAVTAPLVLTASGWLPLNATFVVFAAQSVAIVDVRGAYTFRLGLLLAMSAILAGASALGGAVASTLIFAVLAAGLVAVCGGIWRHFAPDYGASLAISSILLFLISANSPAAPGLAAAHGWSALAGGLWGVFLQVANWPVKPQHPLRRAASDSWIAVANLFDALTPQEGESRSERIRASETALRITLDQTYAVLAAARANPLRQRLDELNLAAARIATRVVALDTALETLLSTTEGVDFSASLLPALTALTNTSRSIAVAVVSRQPGHLATCEVRVQRLLNLLRTIQAQSPQAFIESHGGAEVRTILQQIEQQLPGVLAVLRSTIDRAGEREAFSLELFDLNTWALRPLASAINLNRHSDPALIRYTARVMVLTMMGVAVFEYWDLPHGYWLPLTIVIVLQPDYGSTRQRAAQRVLGTLGGSVLASLLLWLRPPPAALMTTTALTIFGSSFFLKRSYAIAVFFVTLAVVLLTEARGVVTLAFTVERLVATLAGGALAWLAALFFWPVWERDRLPPILADAVDANREYCEAIAARVQAGGTYDAAAIALKRHAESANSAVFSSLQRMMGDPRNRREGLEHIAACANGNQRVTRAITVMAVQLAPGAPVVSAAVANRFSHAAQTLARLAKSLRSDPPSTVLAGRPEPKERSDPSPAAPGGDRRREQAMLVQLARISTELGAMELSVKPPLSSSEPTPVTS